MGGDGLKKYGLEHYNLRYNILYLYIRYLWAVIFN